MVANLGASYNYKIYQIISACLDSLLETDLPSCSSRGIEFYPAIELLYKGSHKLQPEGFGIAEGCIFNACTVILNSQLVAALSIDVETHRYFALPVIREGVFERIGDQLIYYHAARYCGIDFQEGSLNIYIKANSSRDGLMRLRQLRD